MEWELVLGGVVFATLFLLLCPEWWSTSLGILKEKKSREKHPNPDR
jgi:hypothetical protein